MSRSLPHVIFFRAVFSFFCVLLSNQPSGNQRPPERRMPQFYMTILQANSKSANCRLFCGTAGLKWRRFRLLCFASPLLHSLTFLLEFVVAPTAIFHFRSLHRSAREMNRKTALFARVACEIRSTIPPVSMGGFTVAS